MAAKKSSGHPEIGETGSELGSELATSSSISRASCDVVSEKIVVHYSFDP